MNASVAMKKPASIAGLVAFINEQPKGLAINHEYWSTCAVGAYGREVLARFHPDEYWGTRDSVVGQLWQEAGSINGSGTMLIRVRETDHETLMDVLAIAGAKNWDTYGKLRTGLAKKFPELGFIADEPTAWEKFMAKVDKLLVKFWDVPQEVLA